MIGLCIGSGTWLPVAKRAAAQMAKLTGIECRVVDRVDSNLAHPAWHKLNLIRDNPGHDRLFIFDADIWCLKPWNPLEFPAAGDAIAICPDVASVPVQVESQLYHIPPGGYYNAGLMIVRPEAAELFKAVKKLHPRYGSWLEQTGLVAEIHRMKIPHTVMPRHYNGMMSILTPPEQVRATGFTTAHFAGGKTVEQLLKMFDAIEQETPPSEGRGS